MLEEVGIGAIAASLSLDICIWDAAQGIIKRNARLNLMLFMIPRGCSLMKLHIWTVTMGPYMWMLQQLLPVLEESKPE